MSRYEAADIIVRYGNRTILGGVSLAVEPGSLTVLVGPNGAGKSTLLRALAGDLVPAAGSVRLDGSDIRGLKPGDLARRRAVLPQASAISFPMTVHEVVRLGLAAAGLGGRAGMAVSAALERVDLAGFGGRLYHELSGGERQRVHLARVLCQAPPPAPGEPARYLLLDEPTGALDLRHQAMILDVARDFVAAGGGVLAVLHDLNLAAAFADRIAVIRDGAIAASGAPAQVITDAMVVSTYGIDIAVSRPPAPGVPYVLPQNARRLASAAVLPFPTSPKELNHD